MKDKSSNRVGNEGGIRRREIVEVLAWPHNFRVEKAAGDDQAKFARAALKAKTEAQNVLLDAAIVDMGKYLNKELAASLKFAELIRDGVRELLGKPHNGKSWPGNSTIKTAISKRIKRSKLRGLSSRRAKASRTVLP